MDMSNKFDAKKMLIVIILTVNALPILLGCFYGLPSADDFSNTIGWRQCDGNYVAYLFDNMILTYKNWQGTYFGAFLGSFPIYYVFGMKGLRIWLLLIAIAFFFAFFSFSRSVVKWIGFRKTDDQTTVLLFAAIGLSYIFSHNMLDETFYWYTATCVYTLPLILALLCVTCYFRYEEAEKNIYLIIGAILALCGAGGALDVSALLCALLLFGVLYNFLVRGVIRKNIVITIVALLGSIINAVAPGNFARHEVIDSELRLFDSLYYVIRRASITIISEFEEGLLLTIVIVTFIWAYNRLQDSLYHFKYPVLISLYGCFGIVISGFPVALGYSSIDFPQRAVFVERISIIIFVMLCTIYWAGWATNRKIFKFTRETIFVLAFVCILPMSALNEFTPCKMGIHMLKGDYEKAVTREENFVEQIKQSKDMDVVIECEKPRDNEWSNVKKLGLEEDSDSWINNTIAHYYGKNSVTLQYLE